MAHWQCSRLQRQQSRARIRHTAQWSWCAAALLINSVWILRIEGKAYSVVTVPLRHLLLLYKYRYLTGSGFYFSTKISVPCPTPLLIKVLMRSSKNPIADMKRGKTKWRKCGGKMVSPSDCWVSSPVVSNPLFFHKELKGLTLSLCKTVKYPKEEVTLILWQERNKQTNKKWNEFIRIWYFRAQKKTSEVVREKLAEYDEVK